MPRTKFHCCSQQSGFFLVAMSVAGGWRLQLARWAEGPPKDLEPLTRNKSARVNHSKWSDAWLPFKRRGFCWADPRCVHQDRCAVCSSYRPGLLPRGREG